jgi:hypothetical protein
METPEQVIRPPFPRHRWRKIQHESDTILRLLVESRTIYKILTQYFRTAPLESWACVPLVVSEEGAAPGSPGST